jgi:hypothetical protein
MTPPDHCIVFDVNLYGMVIIRVGAISSVSGTNDWYGDSNGPLRIHALTAVVSLRAVALEP